VCELQGLEQGDGEEQVPAAADGRHARQASRAKVLSKLNLRQGYNQILIHPPRYSQNGFPN